jgi:hypothetical protein
MRARRAHTPTAGEPGSTSGVTEHEVRRAGAHELLEIRMMRNRAVERRKHSAEQSSSPGRVHAPPFQYRQHERRRHSARRAPVSFAAPSNSGTEIAEVVDSRAQL